MALPEIAPGGRLRVLLPEFARTTGGAFQIWRADQLVHQGSQYGGLSPDPAPDTWRPLGLVQATAAGYSITLLVPGDAEPGAYELRLATTQGSRSGRFVVTAA